MPLIHDPPYARDPESVPRLRSAAMWRDGNHIISTFRLCYDGPDGYRHACALPGGSYASRRAMERGRCLVAYRSACSA
jgi:hypothetical protein